MNKDDIKLGLLGLCTVLLIVNTYMLATSGEDTPAPAPVTANNTANTPAVNNNPPQQNNPFQNANNQEIKTQLNTNQTNPNTPNPLDVAPTTIAFNKVKHDFGTVKAGSANPYTFEFTNTGDNPLIINNARGNCGCTVPSWPKEPIMPGEKGKMEVVFSPKENQTGQQNKKVTITANIPGGTTELDITANVVK